MGLSRFYSKPAFSFDLYQYLRSQFAQYPTDIKVDSAGAVSSITFESFKVNEDIIEELNKVYEEDATKSRYWIDTSLQFPGYFLSEELFWREIPPFVTRWTPNSLALILKEYLESMNKKQALVFEMALPVYFNIENKHNEIRHYSTRRVTVSTQKAKEIWFFYCLMEMLHRLIFSKKEYLEGFHSPTFLGLSKEDQKYYKTPEEYEQEMAYYVRTNRWTKNFQCDLRELQSAYDYAREQIYVQ